ncbi:MAG: PHP domain-containing protein [Clostridia bacterium]|nr:PHP domain-containing protein [Clostridia bacterium]
MITGDYHTHTIYSHGKGTILENAQEAKKIGLKQLAITDHSFSHSFVAVKRDKLDEMREKINEAEKITGLKIYLGIEANFVSTNGDVDVNEDDLAKLDILLVGFHRFVKSSLKDKFLFFLPNMIFGKKSSKSLKKRNTETLIKALEKYPIDILVHPTYKMHFDIKKVAKKLKETNTLIELNTTKLCLTQKAVKILIDEGVNFIINSDAHIPANVGKVQPAIDFAEKFNIPKERIVNLNKTPIFKKFKKTN